MKILLLISFGILLFSVDCTMNSNQNYNYKNNNKVNKISGLKYRKRNNGLFFCLFACKLNPNCLTIMFKKNSISINTCILYSKMFQDLESIISMGSVLYSKGGFSSQIISVATTTKSSNPTSSSVISNLRELSILLING